MGDAGQPAWGVWLSGLEQGAPPGEAIEDALRWLLEATAAQVAVLFLPDPSGEGVEFASVAGARADELRGFRLRPTDALVAPTLLNREVWRYSAETYQEPIGAVATGIAIPLPSLPKSALARNIGELHPLAAGVGQEQHGNLRGGRLQQPAQRVFNRLAWGRALL